MRTIALSLGLCFVAASGWSQSEEPGAPKLETADPNRHASIEYLEKANAAHPLPTTLLSIAQVYEDWPGHCKEALDTYQRFFEVCEKCQAQSYGVARFEKLIERCVVSIDDEVAIRERVSVPRTLVAKRMPADATPKEVTDAFRLARKVDQSASVRGLLTLIEAGKDADAKLLNELRASAWEILSRNNADRQQVTMLLERIQRIEPDIHTELSARAASLSDEDGLGLSAIRARALAILSDGSSGVVARGPQFASCRANDEREWGRLTVSTVPWSDVYLNGRRVGSTPVHKVDALAGCITVRAVEPGSGQEIVKNVTIRPNKNAILRIDLKSGVDRIRYE